MLFGRFINPGPDDPGNGCVDPSGLPPLGGLLSEGGDDRDLGLKTRG
ncbi:hypothetical protein RISK_006113 [Rhodopirellula islandica]|uniref:Uncharacterized protein n=1 Tax=Rhodopirellula islandica TaxID=595434 RepID=A0A0J1E8X8_RHOIS|nr:hypothetical protein RISK_006113 [Rhodopirellula islandica]